MEMEARIAEAEQHATKWRKQAHEANRRAMELSLKLKAIGDSAADSAAKARSREAAWDNDMRVLKVKVANQHNEARKLKQQLATVRADAAAAASAAEARLANAVAERRKVETVNEALVARLRKLEVEAQQCFLQMEAMQMAARHDGLMAGKHGAQPVRSIDGALELAMRARVKPLTPKRPNTHVRFVDEDAESPAPEATPPGGRAYELVISQQPT
jgi:chromosome segregation ATPase